MGISIRTVDIQDTDVLEHLFSTNTLGRYTNPTISQKNKNKTKQNKTKQDKTNQKQTTNDHNSTTGTKHHIGT